MYIVKILIKLIYVCSVLEDRVSSEDVAVVPSKELSTVERGVDCLFPSIYCQNVKTAFLQALIQNLTCLLFTAIYYFIFSMSPLFVVDIDNRAVIDTHPITYFTFYFNEVMSVRETWDGGLPIVSLDNIRHYFYVRVYFLHLKGLYCRGKKNFLSEKFSIIFYASCIVIHVSPLSSFSFIYCYLC